MSDHPPIRPSIAIGVRLLWITVIILCSVMLVLVARTVRGSPPRGEAVTAIPPAPSARIAIPTQVAATASPTHAPTRSELFGGETGQAMVREARSITLLRLTNDWTSQGTHREDETTGDGIVLGEADVAELQRIFADPASFNAVAYACDPQYGVTLRFAGPRGRLDVLLCFGCSEITMIAAGTLLASTEFDPVRPVLETLVKRLLPQDAQIQALR